MSFATILTGAEQLAATIGKALGAGTGLTEIVEIGKVAVDLIGSIKTTLHTADQGQLDTARAALEAHIAAHEAKTFAALDEAAKR